ncbi:hypothetical protein H4Q26_017688 [Puccinia striiformis f. sp. tritici PST-130]|nr:hypothetical protein H4Q26_017688 [Puccinia striiformis f. sp. tritici PST-130]
MSSIVAQLRDPLGISIMSLNKPPHLASSGVNKANNNNNLAKVAGIPILTPPGPNTNSLSWWYVVGAI